MASTKTLHSNHLRRWVHLLLLLLSSTCVFSGELVEYLPGFDGKLPFHLETGYLRVGDTEFFYYFVKSEGNPLQDPLFLWLTGGPGCSAWSGLVYEIGPMEFDITNYTGGLPRLKYYPYGWTKTASFIFLDAPVGTGFSYSLTQENWYSSDSSAAEQAFLFLRKWLDENPQYLALQLFVGGDSYAGKIAPLVTQKIVQDNEANVVPHLNLQGYLLGSPRTDDVSDENSKIHFAHRMALISDDLYVKMRADCNDNFINVDPSNAACLADLAAYDKAFNYALSYMWANDPKVRDALHVRKGTVIDWKRCNKTLQYTKDVPSVVEVNKFLSERLLQLLVESGDRDLVVPFVGTVYWIKSLNLTLDYAWRPWFVDGQVQGYTVKYNENGFKLTYVTVKGAGHTAPEYKRRYGAWGNTLYSGKWEEQRQCLLWSSIFMALGQASLPHRNVCKSIIEFLPGYPGKLPVKLETGYVGVGDLEEKQLFYYFIESERSPAEDPLLLWLTGGPGCSALSALVYEIDEPIGTGFSYATNAEAYNVGDTVAVEDLYVFIRKWLNQHTEFLANPLYVGGDSYSGIIAPQVTYKISEGNSGGIRPRMNLMGYVLGNPFTDPIDYNAEVEYAYRVELISDELYTSAKTSCHGWYVNPRNEECAADLKAISDCTSKIYIMHVLEPYCASWLLNETDKLSWHRRSLFEDFAPPQGPTHWCRTFNYVSSYIWANNEAAQQALHVRPGAGHTAPEYKPKEGLAMVDRWFSYYPL
ncbi:Peptidase S10, serine carboxypeptidase [Dillenia turbinata]|uniref:Peptidase S10, serine carboxypeptidase n=1 Tax=Dillenia turbinata TaxID=194707 RepID=A0AAN8ZT63_9MAGN